MQREIESNIQAKESSLSQVRRMLQNLENAQARQVRSLVRNAQHTSKLCKKPSLDAGKVVGLSIQNQIRSGFYITHIPLQNKSMSTLL